MFSLRAWVKVRWGLGRHSLGVRLRGGLLVGMPCFGVFVIGGLVCVLLCLLESCGILGLFVCFWVSGDALYASAKLSSARLWVMLGRLRLWLGVLWLAVWARWHALGLLNVLGRFVTGG